MGEISKSIPWELIINNEGLTYIKLVEKLKACLNFTSEEMGKTRKLLKNLISTMVK